MKTKTKFLIFPIFLGLIFGVVFSVNQVNAVPYYNWVQNPSFATYVNYVEDGGFESGSFESGLTYGNWSIYVGTPDIDTDSEYSGVYGLNSGGQSESAIYNLTSPYTEILGADIVELSYYIIQLNEGEGDYARVNIYYSDDTTNELLEDTTFNEWVKADFTDSIEDTKYVVAFEVSGDSGCLVHIDDVVLLVDDGEGQDSIGFETEPWGLGSSSYSGNFGYWNKVTGRLDTTSIQFSGISTSAKILQNLNYVDTDYINYINVYVYGADVSEYEGVTCSLVYSDRTTDEKTVYATGDGSSWENLNFGKSWVDSNKYIIQIRFSLASTDGINDFLIDDVGLWLSVPTNFTKFSFSISPQPISISSFDFKAYSKTSYTINCYYYNETTQELNINGTWQISSSFGIDSGDMTNGFFSSSLDERQYSTSPYHLEHISITIIAEDTVFNIEISAYWYPVSGGVDTGDAEQTASLMTNFFMYGIFFIALPLTMSLYVGGLNNHSIGISVFMAMETVMGAIVLSIGYINLWFMVTIIIVDIVLVFAMLKGRS